jgi:hypothetical protein
MASPLGVSWLAVLEAGGCGDEGWPATSPIADPAAVSAAVDLIGQTSFGTLVEAAVFAAVFESGPWMGDAPAKIAAAYAQAERRAPIAGAIAERFGGQLHIGRRRFDAVRSATICWLTGTPASRSIRFAGRVRAEAMRRLRVTAGVAEPQQRARDVRLGSKRGPALTQSPARRAFLACWHQRATAASAVSASSRLL